MKPKRIAIAAIVAVLMWALIYMAVSPTTTQAPTGRDYVVPDTVDTVNGATNYSHVQPGDRLLIPSSRTGPIVFKNLKGEKGSRIIIINYGGKVKINATGYARGIEVIKSEHIRLTGTGDSSIEYGIEVYGAKRAGIHCYDAVRYIEIDHIHIHDLIEAGAGIRFVNRDYEVPAGWVQYNTHIHHNYIHNVMTEGMYVGTGQGVRDLVGVWIYDNRLERLGNADGIQVRDAVADVEVHHNYINGGPRGEVSALGQEGAGLIVGVRTVGDWHSNMVVNARRGIQLLHPGEGAQIYNNVIVDSGQADKEQGGIQWFGGGSADIYNNTIVNSFEFGMKVPASAKIYDNIVASPTGIGIDGGTAYNNIESGDIGAVGFVDPDNNDFHLLPSSSAVDAGSDTGFAPFDYDGVSRPQGRKSDIGAFEWVSGPPTSTPTPTATNTPLPTFTPTPTSTSIPSPTNTPTLLPTNTPTNTPTSTGTPTPTNTPEPTATSVPTATPGPKCWKCIPIECP